MKAIGADQPFALSEGNLFYEFDKDQPIPKHNELLIKVKAISVNPVDTKIRQTPIKNAPRILGFDAVGEVVAAGPETELFSVGDEVFYSGSPNYDGSNEQYQIIDERYVARKPDNLTYNEAASLPLTGLTAYETLFDVFGISSNPDNNKDKTLLIINGAGGVGSIATQVAKEYGLRVVTTAGRNETKEWSEIMGADYVLNYKEDMQAQLKQQGIEQIDYIFCTFNTDLYYKKMIDLVKPRGHIATIVAFEEDQDLNLLKDKSITFTHEFMYTRALYDDDVIKYHRYLTDISNKAVGGAYRPTVTKVIDGLTADTLYEAHEKLESHSMIGKLVINMEDE
ncbi:zinc-binding alcohol dehydrogenase family protein [Staphylococcus debuckii]|uniref:zinc-binding alcohol dehydrogenase family protein n=1 Tax=Staphylococcus debuckii TaxID=2044912 RepID=UPI000F436841|nr:zinc-binding alcohol dehydrogenase family protein [Staphylococcus debuckii]AYU55810.1 zinc-binding alcohol dehydrogenase family protein [Staphylococcus debuckii]